MKITPAAIEAFRDMELAREAGDSDAWWEAHWILHQQLALSPHEWPAIEYPDDECPYPDGCHAATHWHKTRAARPEAFALYEALKAALGE